MSTSATRPLGTRSCSTVANSCSWRGSYADSLTGGRTPSTAIRGAPAGSEADHLHGVLSVVERRQFACQVLDMHAGAAVDVRGYSLETMAMRVEGEAYRERPVARPADPGAASDVAVAGTCVARR
jgi:hypothetical protein